MNHNASLKDLHIGKIIKEIAQQKGVSSKQIAAVIRRYETNADKIFRLEDMDIEDIVRISYLLEYNLLAPLVKEYLPHFPVNDNIMNAESCLLKIDMRTRRVITDDVLYNCDFLKDIYIGKHIRAIAEEKGYTEEDVAKRLYCVHSTISNLYLYKSLKIKKLVKISNILQYNFIAELYLSKMVILSSWDKFDDCIIVLSPQQVRILNPNSNTLLMIFQRNDAKKQKRNRKETDKEP